MGFRSKDGSLQLINRKVLEIDSNISIKVGELLFGRDASYLDETLYLTRKVNKVC
jgi:hypothetical protein